MEEAAVDARVRVTAKVGFRLKIKPSANDVNDSGLGLYTLWVVIGILVIERQAFTLSAQQAPKP